MMSSNLISLFGTLGAWLRGIVSHLIALVLAPLLDSVRMQFYPPPCSPSRPYGHGNLPFFREDKNAR